MVNTLQRGDEKRFRTAFEITRAFAEPAADLQALLQRVVEAVSDFTNALCTLALVSPDRKSFDVVARHYPAEVNGEPYVRTTFAKSVGFDHVGEHSPAMRAFRSGRAVRATASDPTGLGYVGHATGRAAVQDGDICALPLRSRDDVLGALTLLRTGSTARAFTQDDVELLQVLADHAALAITSAQLIERGRLELLDHKRTRNVLEQTATARETADRRFRIALDVGRRFAVETADRERLLQVVVEETATQLGAYAGLAVLSDDGDTLTFAAQHAAIPRGDEYISRRTALLGHGVPANGDAPLAQALRSDTPIIAPDIKEHAMWEALTPELRELVDEFSLHDLAVIPLRPRGAPLGAITIQRFGSQHNAAGPFDPPDLELLRLVADQAGLAIANAQLLERVQKELAEHKATRRVLENRTTEVQRAHGRLRIALAASRRFATETTDPSRLMTAIVEQTATDLRCYAGLALLSADGELLTFHAEHAAFAGAEAYLARRSELLADGISAKGKTPLARALRTGESVFVADFRVPEVWHFLTPELRALVDTFAVHDFYAMPLRARGAPIGVLTVHRIAAAPTVSHEAEPLDLELADLLADQASLALANCQLLGHVQQEHQAHAQTRAALGRSEEKLRQAQRMEAIGRLAGGVAHDFNNILSVVIGYAELVLDQLSPADPLRAEIEEIRAGGTRAAEVTKQLLAFSRKQILSPRIVDLNEIVEGVERMLSRLIGEDIELKLLLKRPLDTCAVDPGQMEQVLLNLAVNARDAMPNGGMLTIETSTVVLDASYVEEHPEATVGPHVALSVSDTGCGMDRATLSRIFEPFFTTKPKGVGTGLGLATVYGIVKQSNGCIWVYSEVAHGTTFKIYLPRADADGDRSTHPEVSLPQQLGGKETILVVEDDVAVRTLVGGILRRAGYHIMAAANGGEALLLCEQHSATIHMVLTDVVMPRMSGRQLVDRLRQIRPDLKALYMSGYTENAIVHHGVLDSDVDFIQKPITPRALLQRLRAILDRG